jgi:hypothetical protein
MTYTWTVGGDAPQTTVSGASGSLLYSSAATDSVTYSVTATNASGCTSAAQTGTITVYAAVNTTTITGNPHNPCPTTTVALSATASGATTFTWYKDSLQVQTGTSNTYAATASGTYTVQGLNENCTGTTSAAHAVHISSCITVPGCPKITLYQTTDSSDGKDTWSGADKYCRNKGARLPSLEDLICMCAHRASITGGLEKASYWSSGVAGVDYYYVPHNTCFGEKTSGMQKFKFRCVL